MSDSQGNYMVVTWSDLHKVVDVRYYKDVGRQMGKSVGQTPIILNSGKVARCGTQAAKSVSQTLKKL